MLSVRELHAYYGDSHVLQGVSLEVGSGEIVCLLGRNGAGKSTTLKGILGVVPPRSGGVFFNGVEITGRPVYESVRLGLALVPEDRRIFAGLSVQENLEVAALPARPGQKAWTLERIYDTFPLLSRLKHRKGGNLSGGEQQMLAIARAMMSRPKLLLCDEPSLGLAPLITKAMFATLAELRTEQGMAILLVEQNAGLSLELADRAYVLETGNIVASGTGDELLASDTVREAYLGVG